MAPITTMCVTVPVSINAAILVCYIKKQRKIARCKHCFIAPDTSSGCSADRSIDNHHFYLCNFRTYYISFILMSDSGTRVVVAKSAKDDRLRYCLLTGVVASIFYLIHIIVGHLYYPGYSAQRQAVSDLTAVDAPSHDISSVFSTLYGILVVVFSFALLYKLKHEKATVRAAAYLMLMMTTVSLIGYGLFPLDNSEPMTAFQNIMHIVVTILVVILTISSFVCFGIGLRRHDRLYRCSTVTWICLGSMFLGSMLMMTAPTEYFGIYERLNLYAIQAWFVYMSISTYLDECRIIRDA